MRANPRLTLLGGLFLLLTVVLVLAPPDAGKQPPLTVYSSQPEGGKALRLWLEALGHRVTALESERYNVPNDVGVVLLLSPTVRISGAALSELERFVRRGGRLVIAERDFPARELLRRFNLTTRPVADITRAVPAAPGRLDPQIGPMPASPRYQLATTRSMPEMAPLLYGERETPAEDDHAGTGTGTDADADADARPILALRLPVERGELIVLSVPELLNNQSLRDQSNARLALSLIGVSGPGVTPRPIAFDELHHGFGRVRTGSIYSLLFDHAWGRAALWAGVIVLLFLIWRGRRLGRAVPVFVDRGRSLGELVTSQAALYRAGGKRQFVAEHLSRQLRHTFAQAVGLPADATDDEIAAHARTLGRDPGPALGTLAGARNARSDRALVALARGAGAARAELTGSPESALTPQPRQRGAARTPQPSQSPGPVRGRGGDSSHDP